MKALKKWNLSKHVVVVILLVFWIFMLIFNAHFRTWANMNSILREASTTGIAALGMTYIIIMGDFDLSIGSLLALLGMILATGIETIGIVPAIICTCICGLIGGLINGVIIAYCNVPAFITTLGTYYSYRALAYIYKDAGTIMIKNSTLSAIGNGDILGIPIPFIILIVMAIIAATVLTRTIYGRSVMALGNSIKTARICGINTKFVKMFTFGLIGFCTAVSTLVVTARQSCAAPDVATNFHFDAITMVVLGGTKMSGGEGSIWNTVVAAVLYASVSNCLSLYHVDSSMQRIVMGLILLIAFSFDIIGEKITLIRKRINNKKAVA